MEFIENILASIFDICGRKNGDRSIWELGRELGTTLSIFERGDSRRDYVRQRSAQFIYMGLSRTFAGL